MQRIIHLAFLFLFLFSGISLAAKSELYEVQIPFQSSAEANTAQAFSEGFQILLTRLTANPKISDLEQTKKASVKDYLQQYKTSLTPQGKMLVLSFNEQAIDNFLKTLDQPLWMTDRPVTLMWVVLDNKTLLSSSAPHETMQTIESIMNEYALPVLFPIYDLEDINKVTVADITANNFSAIKIASHRYRSDVVLVGHIDATKNSLEAQWSLYMENTAPIDWTVKANTMPDVLRQSILQLLPNLSTYFKENTVLDSGKIALDVENIHDLQDYTEALKHLKNIRSIASIETQKITANQSRFVIELRDSKDRLLRALDRSSHFLVKAQNAEQIILQWQN